MTLVTLLVALIVGRMAQYTSDQVMVQRLQTTRSLREARQAFIVNAAGDALWMVGLSFVGFALFAYFQRQPLPPEFATDKLVPYFMSLAFPAGAVGLVIAAIMAASLSSIDSAINSCASVAVVDFYNRPDGWDGRADRASAGEERRAGRSCLASRDGDLRRLRYGAGVNVARIGTPARDQQQAGQRVHRTAVRHFSARHVQRPRAQQRGTTCRHRGSGDQPMSWRITARLDSCGRRRLAWRQHWPWLDAHGGNAGATDRSEALRLTWRGVMSSC